MAQQGDVFLYQTLDDGNIKVVNGVASMSPGLDTAVYLSLFGGNEDDDGSNKNSSTWWGNYSEIDSSKKYVSKLQNLLQSLPLTSGNLRKIEAAAVQDLQWMLTEKIASNINVVAIIPAPNAVNINIKILAQGKESDFKFVSNWRASVDGQVK